MHDLAQKQLVEIKEWIKTGNRPAPVETTSDPHTTSKHDRAKDDQKESPQDERKASPKNENKEISRQRRNRRTEVGGPVRITTLHLVRLIS